MSTFGLYRTQIQLSYAKWVGCLAVVYSMGWKCDENGYTCMKVTRKAVRQDVRASHVGLPLIPKFARIGLVPRGELFGHTKSFIVAEARSAVCDR